MYIHLPGNLDMVSVIQGRQRFSHDIFLETESYRKDPPPQKKNQVLIRLLFL